MHIQRTRKVLSLTIATHYQVIAVHGRRHGRCIQTGGHELDEGHLRCGILTRDAHWSQSQLRFSTRDWGVELIVKVIIQDFFLA